MAIAVAHSDSPEGRVAMVYAAREAMQRREQLLVLQVLDDAGSDADREALRAEVQTVLDAGGVGESPWELRTCEHSGDRVGALVDLVADSGAGLFVAGSKRMSPIGKFLLERSLQRILLEVDVPVLVVKEPQ
ncbi:universal stress protein [Rhodococcus hoagii]|jgi:nucleotide-binding universal stress UspA family protein|uniref:Universal stress family protein n=3 Tax=Rhodococcus hoagii TaxID=43767 RepID=E9T6C7_RHOHA|nr:universal stress protein [Prescottella equi]MBU4613943.1 universal stress protein [Rhodococcus sp. GG48]MCD7050122.1 universal stress protein [Rhodococcus sp. BH2-1]GBF15264.1 universal stress protein [Rhodococcus sp. Br-6]AVP68655.1 universal stress protein [Prescottella equi]EGD22114.1 universal stress family protein [Prescottella equi ATCC 33707]